MQIIKFTDDELLRASLHVSSAGENAWDQCRYAKFRGRVLTISRLESLHLAFEGSNG